MTWANIASSSVMTAVTAATAMTATAATISGLALSGKPAYCQHSQNRRQQISI